MSSSRIELGFVDEATLATILGSSEEIGKMLRSLIRAIER